MHDEKLMYPNPTLFAQSTYFLGLCSTKYQRFSIIMGWKSLRVFGFKALDSTTNYIYAQAHHAIADTDDIRFPIIIKVHYDPDTSACSSVTMNTPMQAWFFLPDGPVSRNSSSFLINAFYSPSKQAFLYLGSATQFT